MSSRFDIKREFSLSSDRIKALDFHPTETLLIISLFNGFVQLWNYRTNKLVKTYEVTEGETSPTRCVKFIARKQWFVCGSDDSMLRVFNYNTMKKVHQWEAHRDYLRCVVVHPTHPYILSSSDDMSIKLWNWDKAFENTKTFVEHTHYVMQIELNPKNPETFASASLDGTIKVWSLGASSANYTLKGHEKGVNCLSYSTGKDRAILVSGDDDFCVKVWDYVSKQCIATLRGHTNNISFVKVHPLSPVIVSGSEDGTLRVWHASTFRLEETIDYGLDRVWAAASLPNSSLIAIGFDYGAVVISIGDDRPVASMDSFGNVIWFDNYSFYYARVRSGESTQKISDGEPLVLEAEELYVSESYPTSIQHSPNGRAISVLGDNKFNLSTSRKMKNIAFGDAREFVWSFDSKLFAIRFKTQAIDIYFENKLIKSFAPPITVEEIFGGFLLGVRTSEKLVFYDWTTLKLCGEIQACPHSVLWSEGGSRLAVVTEEHIFIYSFNYEKNAISQTRAEIKERVYSAKFIGDFCFLYSTEKNSLKYFLIDDTGSIERFPLAQANDKLTVLGFLQSENRVYFIGRNKKIVSYTLNTLVLALKVDVIKGDLCGAREKLKSIPAEEHTKISKFLQSQNHPELALEITKDKTQIFDLALEIGKLDLAYEVAKNSENELAWKKLCEKALKNGEFALAAECATQSRDCELLFLIGVCSGNKLTLESALKTSKECGNNNVALLCLFYLNRVVEAIDLMVEENDLSCAALFAKTYSPENLGEILESWNKKLKLKNTKLLCPLPQVDTPDLLNFDFLSISSTESTTKLKTQQQTRENSQKTKTFQPVKTDETTETIIERKNEINKTTQNRTKIRPKIGARSRMKREENDTETAKNSEKAENVKRQSNNVNLGFVEIKKEKKEESLESLFGDNRHIGSGEEQ